MLYLLADWSSHFGPLRLFDYVTFRAAGAFLTAFLLVALAIPPLLPFFRKHCVQKSARTDDAPQQKPTTPLMGGVIIIAGIIISTLFWGKLPERTLFVFIIATLGLMALGMVDDIIKTRYLRSEKDGVKELRPIRRKRLRAGRSSLFIRNPSACRACGRGSRSFR